MFGAVRLRAGKPLRSNRSLHPAAPDVVVRERKTALQDCGLVLKAPKRLQNCITFYYLQDNPKEKPRSGAFAEPSDGLEPSTPSLP
jgi:hypothetical protein